MSRIGKQEIKIPAKVEAKMEGQTFTVKGPLGTLSKEFKPVVKVNINGDIITLGIESQDVFARSLWGTYASHIKNMLKGVSEGFQKKMIIEGVGYKYNVNGDKVKLELGLSHDVEVKIPEGLKVVTEKNNMTVSGFDKELVGEFSAKIRSLKRVEPYKGKGIRYVDEVVLRKQGKKSST